jgi:gentisate 1,2-dioxygenase
VQAALDGANLPHATHHYQTPDGKPLSTTIGMQAERLGAGVTTESSRHPSSFLYHCHGGSGRTIIDPPNGERVVVEWTCRDTFAVPAWSRVQHVNASGDEPAYLVAVNDRPFLELLGLTKPGV